MLKVVTVALDTGGAAAAEPWIARAEPHHPALAPGEVRQVSAAVATGIARQETGAAARSETLLQTAPTTAG